jgi:lysozyme family protein
MGTTTTTVQPSQNFSRALNFVLDHEGREVEDVPGDPGGLTKDGITHIDYDQYRREHGLPARSVVAMSPAEELAIYHQHYADPVHFDDLPYVVGLTLFDTAVNTGLGRAIVWLQKELGVDADGGFGPNTLGAANEYITKHGASTLAMGVIARREQYYRDIAAARPALQKFLAGWTNRISDLRIAIV